MDVVENSGLGQHGDGIVSRDTIVEVPVDRVASNPHQPRKDFGGIEGLGEVD
jgi:hypothetical protein